MITEESLFREFQRVFAQLDDFAAKNEASGARIREFIMAHMRSSAPMAVVMSAAPKPAEVVRDLECGGKYEVSRDDKSVRLYLRETPDHDAAVVLNAIECFRLRQDIDDVASTAVRR